MSEKRFRPNLLLLYWLFAFLYWEILAHLAMFAGFSPAFRFALGIGGALGVLTDFVLGLLPSKAIFPVSMGLTMLGILLYGSQMVYCFIFGTPYSVSQMGLGAGAVGQFWREMLSAMGQNWLWLAALLVPMLLALLPWVQRSFRRLPGKAVLLLPVLAAAVLAGIWLDIGRGGQEMFSDYYFFTSPKSTTAQTMERFGVPITYLLELTRPEDTASSLSTALPQLPSEEPAPQSPVQEQQPLLPNVLPIDFEVLNAKTTNPILKKLNTYFSQAPATHQNAYTGRFRDYNLILICAESFSPAAIHPVYTPTLYQMTQKGFRFHNYYNTFPNTTTDGEYALMQGLFTDSTREKFSSSMIGSGRNYLPFALGNLFRQQLGVDSWGYHNNIGDYYQRNQTHPNMGYAMKFNNQGMQFTGSWPTSDLEMMEQSVDDYIHESQFHAYYMTFSGHYEYRRKTNGIVRQNYAQVEQDPALPEEGQKSYMACHIELDKAMAYLLDRLEQEGIADRTVIVLASDHTPYGMQKKQYFQMLGQPEDLFGWYKSQLIFWVGDMEEPVDVYEYCCTVDILPTILNLWGFSYDSRLFPGTDVFSDGVHAAVLADRSFLTDKVWFHPNTGETRYQIPQEEVPPTYIAQMNQLIASRFEFSADLLRTNYYQYLSDNCPTA